ncbi:GTP-binding protein [Streptomyces sp. NPDC051644]|uniref:GTP-binding protein n=1 Tax=Streptomyces sp. NPDC051644 TaxID=3365666 RepID=UPI00379E7719
MAYAHGSDADAAGQDTALAAEFKIVIAGGFGVGKTTLVATLSEIEPLTTEARLSAAGAGVDDLAGIAGKTSTTVAMDFGRVTFDAPLLAMILYLFGVPGQERFWFMWDDLGKGAVGAVVLVDTRRLEDSFTAVSWYEQQKLPFVIAVNEFDYTAYHYDPDEVRQALGLGDHVPIVTCDVRQHASAMNILITLVEHSLELRQAATTGASV